MIKYYLAVDIGASGGRHIVGHLEGGRLVTEEIYRFSNGFFKREQGLCWDLERLFREIITGMKKCVQAGKIPVSMGIDTWGVDFVLLDENQQLLGNAVAYRDNRTKQMDQEVYRIIPEAELYKRTGIQKQNYNTIYQLMALKKRQPELLEKAKTLLMLPDYFHYRLTGRIASEYTQATTTQLVSPITKDWDKELIKSLGYPEEIFQEILMPGTPFGYFLPEIQVEAGFNCEVVLPATHDTGSAVLAVPSTNDQILYISSGTWSLLGTEKVQADCSEQSRIHNFTNEGGYGGKFRYLKNIMGLWMIQSVRKEFSELNSRIGSGFGGVLGGEYTYGQLCEMAEKETIDSLVDCNDEQFLAPDTMCSAIRRYCKMTGQQTPKTPGEFAAVIYRSLAQCYQKAILELEELTGITYSELHIVGGGSNADYFNRLTAKCTGKKVLAGPGEATAIGNLAAQMLGKQEFPDVESLRRCIRNSYDLKSYS